MSYKKVKDQLEETDSEDDQFQRQDEKDIIQRMYEGGAAAGNDRFNDKYGNDVQNFNVKNSGITEGLVESRGCTDIFCLIIFVAFLGSLGYATYYSNANGDVNKLLAPVYYDLDGKPQLCGAPDFKTNKYLYFTDLSPENMMSLFQQGICVDKCPAASTDEVPCTPTKYVKCDKPITSRASHPVLNICIPNMLKGDGVSKEVRAKWAALWEQFKSSSSGSMVNDLYLSSSAITASIVMAPIYCFIFIFLMSAFAETIAWLCVALVQLGLLGGVVACYLFRTKLTATFDKETATIEDPTKGGKYLYDNLNDSYRQNMQYLMGGMITFGILALLFGCCVCLGWRSLKLAIDVIDASADFLWKTKRIIFVPILYFFVTLIVIFVWIGMFFCVISMNKIEPSTKIPQMKFITWTSDANYYLAWYMFFALLWLYAFVEYKTQFIIQVSAASYYFDSSASKDGEASVGKGFKFAYLNHMGSLAMGSFIIGAIRLVKFVFVYAARKAAAASGDNKMSQMALKCGTCYIQCLEKVTDYLNEAAFCYMAVSGENFAKSAWNGFLLNIKHLLQFSFSNLIAKVFMFLGKVGITTGNVFSCIFIMKSIDTDSQQAQSVIGPCIIVGVFTYFTASVFLGLFDTAVMSMMTSLAIDLDMNNGEPRFGPPTFHGSVTKISKNNDEYNESEKYRKMNK